MKKTINISDFHHAFETMERQREITYDARVALFSHLEEMEEGTGEEMELDVVALCCEWSEYDSAEEAAEQYVIEIDPDITDPGERADAIVEALQDRTTVITFGNNRTQASDYAPTGAGLLVAEF